MTFVDRFPRTLKTARILLAGLFLSTAFVFSVSTDADAKLARRNRSAAPAVDIPEEYTQDWEDEVEAKKRREDSGKDWREPSASKTHKGDQVPEIDPGVARGAATLLLGGLTVLRYRRKR